MEFVNETGEAADLLRSELRGDLMVAALIVRARYRIEEGRRLGPCAAAERLYDLRRARVDLGDYGFLEIDQIFPRQGTDVIVLGDAAARGDETPAMRVQVKAGPYDVAVNVFGDRVWEKALGSMTLTPSPPKPFRRMPVTLRNAFGGAAAAEYGPIPFYQNPVGKGFYWTRDEALGRPLPNVESPFAPIAAWSDRPEPIAVGPYPPNFGLRLLKIFEPDVERQQVSFHPERGLCDIAHPALSGQRVEGGAVRIAGMSEAGAIEFELPERPFEVCAIFGPHTYVRDLELEEILVDVRTSLVDLTYRKLFKYEFVPHQIRRTILRRRGA